MNIVEPILRQARIHPDRPALIGRTRQVTYRQLHGQIVRIAAQLAAAGVGRGQRVGLVMRGGVPHVVATLAVAYRGGVSVGLPTGGRAEDRVAAARHCGLDWVAHNLAADWTLEGMAGRCLALNAMGQADATGSAPAMACMEPADLWRIGHSSGTTGVPKAIGFTHGEHVLKTMLQGSLFPATPQDRVMLALGAGLPFAWNYWTRPLYAGAAVLLLDDLEAGWVLEQVRSREPTVLVAAAGTAISLASALQQPGCDFQHPPPQLRTLIVGGGFLPATARSPLRRQLCPGLSVNYGSSEAGLMAVADAALQDAHPGCAGRLLPWVEMQAVDAEGQVLPTGTSGMLRVRSPVLAQGYIAGQAEGGRGFRNGWFYSNDHGSVTADGLLFLGGRDSDVLNLSGVKVNVNRIEEVIALEPGVRECAVLAVPGRLGEPVLVAAVVAAGELDARAVKQRCRDALGGSATPRFVLQFKALPRNEGGKVDRERLRRRIRNRAAQKAQEEKSQ
jgi:acyl-CoA synthetase (AMP-forming)/AMP-acid ligase II